MPSAMIRSSAAAIATAILCAFAGCHTGLGDTAKTQSAPLASAPTQPTEEVQVDQLVVEVTLLRANLSNHSLPTDHFDLWQLLAEPANPSEAIDAVLVGNATPQPGTELHVIEVADAPRLIRALDEVCDICLVTSPKFTMLGRQGNPCDAIYIPGPGPYAGMPAPPHPLDAFGLRFGVDHRNRDSTTFNLSVARYPQIQPEGQQVHAAEGPDYSGESTVLHECPATFEDGKTYIVGGFADWRYVGPVTAWDLEDQVPATEVQEEELFAIIKVTRVIDDVLIPLEP